MKGEKGSLKNKIKKERDNQKKQTEFVTIQTATTKSKNNLKNLFSILFSFLENIGIDTYKKDYRMSQTTTDEEEKYIYKQVELENISLYEKDDIVKSENKSEKNNYIINDMDNNLKYQESTKILQDVQSITNQINSIDSDIDMIIKSNKDIKEKRKDIIHVKEEIQTLKKYYMESIASFNESLKELGDDIDPYHISVSPKKMNELLQKCDTELSKIKKQRKHESIEDLKINKELENIKSVIDENLEEQKKDIDKLRTEFNKVESKDKRAIFVKGIYNFLLKTMNIGLSFSTIIICKNKFISFLGNAVILNNRLRNIRKIIHKDNNNITFITYKDIASKINCHKSCLVKTKEILEDSLYQLQNLKQEFIIEFYHDMDRYPEAEDIMTEFSSIEYQITSKTIEVEEMLQALETVGSKIKVNNV